MKARNLSVSKVRHVLPSKPSSAKFAPATGELKRLKAFARFIKRNFCMVLEYLDKLGKDSNGVKFLIVRQELFDRTTDTKGMKAKDSKGAVRACLTMITKENRPQKFWVDKATENAGEFENLCKAEGLQVYSIMSETKSAFPERTIRSLKNMFYRYMEVSGYKYIHKFTQFSSLQH